LITLAIIVLLWLGANLIHLLWIQVRYNSWNRKVARTPCGLLENAESFSCGSGESALIFIHGFADLPHGWKRITERLTNSHEVACHAIRVPRWGEDLKSARGVSIEEIRATVDKKVKELSASHRNIWLVGHSLGCAIAIDAVPRNKEHISGLVMMAPLLRVSNRRVPCFTARFWYSLGKHLLFAARTFESPFTERITAADDPDFSYAVDKFVPYSVYNILFQITETNRSIDLPKKLPIFCALSTRDKVIDSDFARMWFDSLANPKELYLDNESEHALQVGKNWKELTDRFYQFIEKSNTHENKI